MKQRVKQINSPLLYRLTDDEPALAHSKDQGRYIDFDTLHADVKSNLEHILNTRLGYFGDLKPFNELNKSILNYGMADFSQQYASVKQHQQELCQLIQDTIAHFEPRLQNVKVTLLSSDVDVQRSFLVRIFAEINIKPEPQQAVFESNLDIVRYQFTFEDE